MMMLIIVEPAPPCQSGVWVFAFFADPEGGHKALWVKVFYMASNCEKPVEGLTLLS
jgi:hypothetical protein